MDWLRSYKSLFKNDLNFDARRSQLCPELCKSKPGARVRHNTGWLASRSAPRRETADIGSPITKQLLTKHRTTFVGYFQRHGLTPAIHAITTGADSSA
jgi:hypothetical protein